MSMMELMCVHGFELGEGCSFCKGKTSGKKPDGYWVKVFKEAARLLEAMPNRSADECFERAQYNVLSHIEGEAPQPSLPGGQS